MMKISEVIVVEGKSDTTNLKRFFECETYETGGSAIDAADLERLKILQEKRGLIIFTDPDFQGERIRKIIMAAIPEAKHAFIRRDEGVPVSKSKGHSLGVEHADGVALEAALSGLFSGETTNFSSDIRSEDLQRMGLVMGKDSRRRREHLGEALRIGYVNGKGLLKRLQLFGVCLEEVEEVMRTYGD
ncbi:MAG: ribonuclease M5 [Streptococcaceae bacterium]|jgi:ribonuclease M5|nr:ribonuclease M5 [Streptococcaceae bacterium]